MRGVKGLMIAVLDEAMTSLASVRRTRSQRVRTHGLAALRWIKSGDASHPFSFVSICDALGLDPDRTRRQVLDESGADDEGRPTRQRVERRVETNLPKISLGRRRGRAARAKEVA